MAATHVLICWILKYTIMLEKKYKIFSIVSCKNMQNIKKKKSSLTCLKSCWPFKSQGESFTSISQASLKSWKLAPQVKSCKLSLSPLVFTICSSLWWKLSFYAGPQLFMPNFCPAFCLFWLMKTRRLWVCLTEWIKSSWLAPQVLCFEANRIKKDSQFSLKSHSISRSLYGGSSVQAVE